MALTTTTTMALFLFLFMLSPSFSTARTANRLSGGETLRTDDYLQLGIHTLIMQPDCNLVLYRSDGVARWSSKTGGRARNCACVMQKDGNLVVYRNDGTALWASKTGHREQGKYVLILQADGNVVIYRSGGTAIWATNIGVRALIPKLP